MQSTLLPMHTLHSTACWHMCNFNRWKHQLKTDWIVAIICIAIAAVKSFVSQLVAGIRMLRNFSRYYLWSSCTSTLELIVIKAVSTTLCDVSSVCCKKSLWGWVHCRSRNRLKNVLVETLKYWAARCFYVTVLLSCKPRQKDFFWVETIFYSLFTLVTN